MRSVRDKNTSSLDHFPGRRQKNLPIYTNTDNCSKDAYCQQNQQPQATDSDTKSALYNHHESVQYLHFCNGEKVTAQIEIRITRPTVKVCVKCHTPPIYNAHHLFRPFIDTPPNSGSP